MAATARNSLCQFWNDWNQNSDVRTNCQRADRRGAVLVLLGVVLVRRRRSRGRRTTPRNSTANAISRVFSYSTSQQTTAPHRPRSVGIVAVLAWVFVDAVVAFGCFDSGGPLLDEEDR